MKVSYISEYTFATDGDWVESFSTGRKVRVIYSDTVKFIYYVLNSTYNPEKNLTYVKLSGNNQKLSPEIKEIELAVVSNKSLPVHEDYPYRENYFWSVLQNSPYKSCIFDLFFNYDDNMVEKLKTNPRYDDFTKSYIFENKDQFLTVNLMETEEYRLGVSLAVICEKDSDFNFYYNCGQGDIKISPREYHPQFWKRLKVIIKPRTENVLPTRISSIGVLYGIYKNNSFQTITEPDAELKVDRKEITIDSTYIKDKVISTPEFRVGSSQLTVFLDGKLLTPSLDYLEIGEKMAISNSIKLLRNISGSQMTFLVHQSKSLFDSESPIYYFPRWFESLAGNIYQLADRVTKLELENADKSETGTTLSPQGETITEGVKIAPVVVVSPDGKAPKGSAVVLKREIYNDKQRTSE